MSDFLENELYHHGIKGQRWGVRRYQREDGSLTELGKVRYGADSNPADRVKKKTISADGDVTFDNLAVNRIQMTNEFIKEYPFFATHEQTDSDFYKGMFGHSLHRRYGSDEPVYQLNLSATAPISIPSEKKRLPYLKIYV